MTLTIDELLKKPEGKTLEFKRDLSSPRNFLRTLVAFANTAGGRLIIGIDDQSHDPFGVNNPLDEEERLCSLIADSIEPRLVPNIEIIDVGGKSLLLVDVYLSNSRPHWIKREGPEGVYVRLGSTNRKADRELIAELKRSVDGVSYDELPVPQTTIDDIDLNAMNAAFDSRGSLTDQELVTLKLLVRDQGQLVPSKGAMLLFGKQRELHFPDAWIQCGRFRGKDKADIYDHIEIHNHLPIVVVKMMEFLKKHAIRSADFSELKRRDIWSIPITILREAIINSVVHADYSQIGAPIRLAIFDDRIEIENPGILLPGLTMDDLKLGISKIRNRVIARIFRELDLIEQWGSGLRRIFTEAETQKLRAPELLEVGTRFRFTVYLSGEFVSKEIESGVESGVESKMGKEILQYLKSKTLGKKDIAAKLGKSKPTRHLNDLMRKMLENGFIEYTIPDKPNSSRQKYRMTDKGRKIL